MRSEVLLTRLTLTDFRSYPEALLAPGPGFVILTGENGAGKTNVLEAAFAVLDRIEGRLSNR